MGTFIKAIIMAATFGMFAGVLAGVFGAFFKIAYTVLTGWMT